MSMISAKSFAFVSALWASTGLSLAAAGGDGWTLKAPGNTIARTTETGSILLKDTQPYDDLRPVAMIDLPSVLSCGELRWRTRNVHGVAGFSIWLHAPGEKQMTWDIGVHPRGPVGTCVSLWKNRREQALVEVGSTRFNAGADWLEWRLLFDTAAGRAQLYLDGQASPVAEVRGFDQPLSQVSFVLGFVDRWIAGGMTWGTGHGVEVADFQAQPGNVIFQKVEKYSIPSVWPQDRPAPADWIVEDKFEQFVSWWPGPVGPASDGARSALREALRHEAIGAGNGFLDAFRVVPRLANGIRWEEPFKGAQASHLYRSSPEKHSPWDKPDNARLMEAVGTLVRFYSIDQPWNPYHRDAALGKRIRMAMDYWLSLQTAEGGFPEYNGLGSSELPAVSFNLFQLVDIYDRLRREPGFEALSPRLLDAIKRAIEWASIPGSTQRVRGGDLANQYLGVIYAAWQVHHLTSELRWKALYDDLTDWWIDRAQQYEWYLESNGREDFGYSKVSDAFVDFLVIVTQDSRWIESLRRSYAASQLIATFEMDRQVAVVDTLSHNRTQPKAIGSMLAPGAGGEKKLCTTGLFNHIATQSIEARAFAFDVLTPGEIAVRETAFFSSMPASLQQRVPLEIFPIGPNWTWDRPNDYWPLAAEAQYAAVADTLPWKESRFTKLENYRRLQRDFAAARRPGYYFTLHGGAASHFSSTGLGLLWVPGFGNVLRSSNRSSNRAAFGWQVDGVALHAAQKQMRIDWGPDGAEKSKHAMLLGQGQPIINLYLGDESLALGLPADAIMAKPFYLPFVFRKGDQWIADDGPTLIDPFGNAVGLVVEKSLRLTRSGEGVTHDLQLEFSAPTQISFATVASSLDYGLHVRGVAVRLAGPQSNSDLKITFTRILR